MPPGLSGEILSQFTRKTDNYTTARSLRKGATARTQPAAR